MEDIDFRELCEQEITKPLFLTFNRYQEIRKCRRKSGGLWADVDVCYTEQWNSGDFKRLIFSLVQTVRSGGTVLGAFRAGALAGFSAIENTLFGTTNSYLELSYFHVTYELRRCGIGRRLFELSCQSARQKGAGKLYISSNSSVETQAFYSAMGCVEAEEPDKDFMEREPCDIQLEFSLTPLPADRRN